MNKGAKLAAGVLITTLAASAAWAWGQTEMRTKELWTETLRVNMRDGRHGVATTRYEITTGFQINEGSGSWGRNCDFSGQSRAFHRTIVVKPDGADSIPLGDKTIALPNATSYHFDQPCSDVVGQLDQKLSEQLGNYDSWRPQIDADLQQVHQTISLFALVDH